jgi:predicted RNA-binding protein YlqC (UPF0109 family)
MSNSIDQQFVEFVVKSLVSKPDAVVVERRIDEKGVLLELTVDPEDLGRVIGKRGATAQSLRTLLRALGTKNDARYNLKIIDNGVPGAGHSSSSDDDYVAPSAPAPATDDASGSTSSAKLSEELGLEESETASSDEHNDRLTQTRQELADLDDLDV